jgi:hypothetical protein
MQILAIGLEEYHQYCIIPKFMYYPRNSKVKVNPLFIAFPGGTGGRPENSWRFPC